MPVTHKSGILHEVLPPVWEEAERKLSTAREIVIFGYTCPSIDLESRNLLQRSIIANRNLKSFTIIDPDPNVIARYIELTGIIKKNKKQFKKTYTYFARDRKIKTKLNREKLYLLALEKKILKKTTLGAGEIMSIKSKDLFSVSGKMLEENPYSLVTIPK